MLQSKTQVRERSSAKMEIKSTRGARCSIKPVFTMLCLLVEIQVTVGILIEEPENTVVMFNGTTTLKCKSDRDRKLQWHLSGDNLEEVELWSGYFLNPKACQCPCCEIDNHEPGKYNLNITARKETAKRYMCTEPGTLMRASADIIVIESELNCTCTCNETSSDVMLTCAIGVDGRWSPKIKWNNSNGEQVNEAIVYYVENGKVTSTLTIRTMKLKYPEVSYTASVYFDQSDRPAEVTATNVPSYTAEWTSPPVKRRHAGSSVIIPAIVASLFLLAAAIAVSAAVMKIKSRRYKKAGSYSEENETCVNHKESMPV